MNLFKSVAVPCRNRGQATGHIRSGPVMPEAPVLFAVIVQSDAILRDPRLYRAAQVGDAGFDPARVVIVDDRRARQAVAVAVASRDQRVRRGDPVDKCRR